MGNISEEVVEKIKEHIFCAVTFSENRAFHEIMTKNIVEPCKPLMAIWCMRFACCMTKA
jgi:hypothetical protein